MKKLSKRVPIDYDDEKDIYVIKQLVKLEYTDIPEKFRFYYCNKMEKLNHDKIIQITENKDTTLI